MADRYWVWWTWNWNDTAHWSTTSGGSSGAAVPTSSDNVIFDTNSHSNSYTVTINVTANFADMTWWNPSTWKPTLAGSSQSNAYWNVSFVSWMTVSYTWEIWWMHTSGTKTLTTNSVSCSGWFRIRANGTLQLADNLTCSWVLYWDSWVLDTNTKTISCWTFGAASSNTSTLTLTSSTITCTSVNLYVNKTLNVSGNVIKVTGSGSFTGWTKTYNEVQFNWASHTIFEANSFATLTRTGTAAKTDSLILAANQTITGTLTLNGNSSVNRLLVQSNTKWTARTLTAATVSVTNADFQDITGAWAWSWDLSAITWKSWDCGGNSGITFTTPVTTDCSAGTTWSTATWSSRVPLPQDTATFSGSSRTITQNMSRIGSVNFTGSSGLTWTTSTACSVFGSINLTDLGTLTWSTQDYTLEWRWTNTLKNAGKVWDKSLSVNCATWNYTLLDDLSFNWANRLFGCSSWTLYMNNFNVSCGFLYLSWGTTYLWSGLFVVSWTAGVIYNCSWTIDKWTSTIKLTWNLTANWSFAWGWKTYHNFWNATTGAFAVTITGSNTFNDFKINAGRTQKFTAWTTQTVSTFTAVGTTWNLITLDSSSTATYALTKTWGGTISCDYLSVQHSVASPANTWYAGTNSTNNQAVATAGSGWIFTAPPPPPTAEFLMFF